MTNLSDLLADAIVRGLTNLSLHRMHDKAGHWQASSRWTWSDGYRIAVEPTPHDALTQALSQQPTTDQQAKAPVAEDAEDDGGVFA